jgi:hypothetical protein
MFETLESRQLRSASSVVSPATSFATTTALDITNRSTTLGQPITIKATVTSSGGVPKGGTVELLDDNKDTGLVGTLNHLGYYVFTLDAGESPYVGTQEYRIRFLTDGDFVGSISRDLSAKVAAPKYTAESSGIDLATVVAGTGTKKAESGDTVVVQYTGYDAANGVEFDESDAHGGTFSFVVDSTVAGESVITGFDDEVTGMKVGQTDVAVIPSALGYDDGETRIFVLHVVSIS